MLVNSDDFNIKSVILLLVKVVDNAPDVAIWSIVYDLVTELIPPSRQLPYPYQIPISFNTSSLVNMFENRKYLDNALKDELGSSLYIDVPGLFDAFFGKVTNLEPTAEVVFKKC